MSYKGHAPLSGSIPREIGATMDLPVGTSSVAGIRKCNPTVLKLGKVIRLNKNSGWFCGALPI